MEDSISRKLRLAHEKYLKDFLASDPARMAELAGGTLEGNIIKIAHFNDIYAVHTETGAVEPKPKQLLEEILIIKYLCEAQGMEGPGSDYLAFQQLPCGGHHIKAFKAEVTNVLVNAFGANFSEFKARCEALGGVPAKDGDIAYVLRFFPKISVKVIIWEADEEFPAASNFLFDNKCTFHMDTDGLNELANATAALLAEGLI